MEARTGTGKQNGLSRASCCEVTVITSTPLALSLKCATINKDQDN